MAIKLNTNPSAITVYDETGYKHATGDQVVPLITNLNRDIKDLLIDILSNSLGLSNTDKELYKFIITIYNSEEGIDVKSLITKVSIKYNKANITYRRSIDSLVRLGVIRYTDKYTTITINDSYNVTAIADTAKYIVIEINRPIKSLPPLL